MIKIWTLLFISLGMSMAAQAGDIRCTGRYQGRYNFTMSAHTNVANRLRGNILVQIRGTLVNKTFILAPTFADIRPGKYLRIAGRGPMASGKLQARYNSRSMSYPGYVDARIGATTARVPVVCMLSGGRGIIDAYTDEGENTESSNE